MRETWQFLTLGVVFSFVGVAGAAAETARAAIAGATPAGAGAGLGSVVFEDGPHGLLITPDLTGFSPGAHGFHVHTNPVCDAAERDGASVPALGAGGHYDPDGSGHHDGPYGAGHLGDLPVLIVADDGTATLPLLAPRLNVAAIKDRAIVIHAGGDNYADNPAPLGGGGARVACGIIE